MADIVPPPTPERRDPWSLADGCPECVQNTEAPWAVTNFADGGFMCAYCGHAWTTSWGA